METRGRKPAEKRDYKKEAGSLIWKAMELLGELRNQDAAVYVKMSEKATSEKEGMALHERMLKIGNQIAALGVIARDLQKIK